MRIRTDGDYAYRNDAIDRAADFYDCNKTKADVSACDDVPQLVAAARQVLKRDAQAAPGDRRDALDSSDELRHRTVGIGRSRLERSAEVLEEAQAIDEEVSEPLTLNDSITTLEETVEISNQFKSDG